MRRFSRSRRIEQVEKYRSDARETLATLPAERAEVQRLLIDDTRLVATAAARAVADDARIITRVESLRRARLQNHFTDRARLILGAMPNG